MSYQYNPNNQQHTITLLRRELEKMNREAEALQFIIKRRGVEITGLKRRYQNALKENARLIKDRTNLAKENSRLTKELDQAKKNSRNLQTELAKRYK